MASDAARLERELTEALLAHREALLGWLGQAFRRLGEEAEDVLQDAVKETLGRVRTEGFCPKNGWAAYLRWVARRRAIDRLRTWERRVFQQLEWGGPSGEGSSSSGRSPRSPDPADLAPGPATQLKQVERRGRQGLLLSDVLQEFTRWCESRPGRLRIKEAYERSLRGQQPAQISAGLGISSSEVHTLLHRARQWVFERIRQADVDRSIFVTLHGRKPE